MFSRVSGTWLVYIRGASVTQLLNFFWCGLPRTKRQRPEDQTKILPWGRGKTGGIQKTITDGFYWAAQRRPILSKASQHVTRGQEILRNYAVNSTRLSSRTAWTSSHFPIYIYPVPWEPCPVKWSVASKWHWQWWKQPGAQADTALRTRVLLSRTEPLWAAAVSDWWAPTWQSTRGWALMYLSALNILEISGIRHSAWHHWHSFKMSHDFCW